MYTTYVYNVLYMSPTLSAATTMAYTVPANLPRVFDIFSSSWCTPLVAMATPTQVNDIIIQFSTQWEYVILHI